MEVTKTITILKAESRSYTKDGVKHFFNQVSALVDGRLEEMNVEKNLVDYIIQNKSTLMNIELDAVLTPRGYNLDSLVK